MPFFNEAVTIPDGNGSSQDDRFAFTVHLPVPVDLIVIMFCLSIVITLGATLLSAWSASGEKPLAALRYE